MGLGTGALVGLHEDHDIEPVGEFFVPNGQLVDGRMNVSVHGSGFETARRQVLIIELVAVLAPRAAPGVGAVIGPIQRCCDAIY